MVYMGIPRFWLSVALLIGSYPILALPSVMRMMFFLPAYFCNWLLASNIASPIFVPESPGFSWRIYWGEIPWIKWRIPLLSEEWAMLKNGFPAKRMSPKCRCGFSETNDWRMFFAWEIRFGIISSASIDREISSIIMTCCDSVVVFVCVEWRDGHDMIMPKRAIIKNRMPHRRVYSRGRLSAELRSALGSDLPIYLGASHIHRAYMSGMLMSSHGLLRCIMRSNDDREALVYVALGIKGNIGCGIEGVFEFFPQLYYLRIFAIFFYIRCSMGRSIFWSVSRKYKFLQ